MNKVVNNSIVKRINSLKNDLVFKKVAAISQELKIKTYLVGGAVRDLFIRKSASLEREWDFAVDRGAIKLSRCLAKELNASYVVLDKVHKAARVVYTAGPRHYELDFIDLRAAILKSDLNLRDFTINTLCLDIDCLWQGKKKLNDYLLDYFNARRDIKAKRIRVTSITNFRDDPLRILRGFAFCAQFNFKFNPKTAVLIKRYVSYIKNIPAERISEELVRLFNSARAFLQVKEMDKLGILKIIFPDIAVLQGMDQGPYHHLDIWQHSLETLKQMEKILASILENVPKKYRQKLQDYLKEEIACKRPRTWILKLGCLLHDIGKAKTRIETKDGRLHFYTHEQVGAEMVKAIGKRLKLSGRENQVLKNMIFYHLRPGQLVERQPSRRAKFRFFRDAKQDAVLILLLALADRRAMQGVLTKKKTFIFLEDEIINMIIEYFKKLEVKIKPPRLLTGHELMSFLHIPAGPLVGKILREIDEAQGIKLISSKEQAKDLAVKIYNGGDMFG